jgi:purine-binding chemotaxis protein CheW
VTDTFILFLLAGTTYALRTDEILHVEMIEEITPVPNAAPHVEGVVFSRGQVVPVVSLRARFGFPRVAHDVAARLLVVRAAGRVLGFTVDSAREFVRIAPERIEPPAENISGLSGRYLEGIARLGDRIVLVLALGEVADIAEDAVVA